MRFKKFQDFFGHMKLQKRLMSFFIIVCIIPLAIIGTISIYFSINATKESAIEFSDSTLLQVRTRIESIMDVAETVSLQIAHESIIQTNLKKTLSKDISEKYKKDLEIDTYLNSQISYMEEIYGLYVIGENKGKYKSAYNSFIEEDLTISPWYQRIMYKDEAIWFSSHQDSYAVNTSGQHYISRGMKIQDLSSKENLGVIVVDIELEKIEDILKNSFGKFGQVIIINENQNIIASTGNLFENDSPEVHEATLIPKKHPTQHLYSGKNNELILYYPLINSQWYLIGIIPSSTLYKDSYISVGVLITLFIAMCFISYIIAKVMSVTITQPIDNIISQMKEVESGNFDVKTEIKYDDEIGNLTQNFNKMTTRVDRLMTKNIQEQKKLRKSELKALQSQINPHLLYNTLGSVIWLARMNQTNDIIEIVTAMTNLFRISLSRGKDIITIEEEIEHVKSYLKIQKLRYPDHFTYDINIAPEIQHYKTLKLVLQPLVENAIYHGIKVKRKGGTIKIMGEEVNNKIILKVIDTGVGMSRETIKSIHQTFETNEESSVTVYGIKNVNERIRIFFGDAYGLHYESTIGEGTTATITLAQYTGDEKVEKV